MNRVIFRSILLFSIAILLSLGCSNDDEGPTGSSEKAGYSGWKTTQLLGVDSLAIANFYGASFLNVNTGWVVGDGAYVFKTSDGGTSWNMNFQSKNTWLFDVYPINDSSVWAVGMTGQFPYNPTLLNLVVRNGILDSVDTAITLNTVGQLRCIEFIDTQIGFAFGGTWPAGNSRGTMARTTDGGVNWDFSLYLQDSSSELRDLDFGSSTTGFMVSATRPILVTTDAGASWTPHDSIMFDSMMVDGIMVDSMMVDSIMVDGIMVDSMMVDGIMVDSIMVDSLPIDVVLKGSKFKDIKLYGIDMINSTVGWAVGSFSAILKTTKAGIIWDLQYIDSTSLSTLKGVSFLDVNNGIVVGDGGRALITTDGGTSWADLSFRSGPDIGAPLGDDLTEVFYLSAGNIVAIGEDFIAVNSR